MCIYIYILNIIYIYIYIDIYIYIYILTVLKTYLSPILFRRGFSGSFLAGSENGGSFSGWFGKVRFIFGRFAI